MRTFLRIIGEWEVAAHLANRMDGPEEEPNSRDTASLCRVRCEMKGGRS